MEPSVPPSPPNAYPNSPITPVSSANGIPASQPFRQSNQPRPPLALSTGTPDSSVYRSDLGPTYSDSAQSSPSTHSLPPRVENINHRSHPAAATTASRRRSYGQLPSDDDKRGERLSSGSISKSALGGGGGGGQYGQFDSDDERRVKRETASRSPSISMSPRTSRADRPRSQSFAESETKDPKLDQLQAKKKGAPVFRGSDMVDYYENEPVPDDVEPPHGWQIGTGKQTKGLLLPKEKDGIPVNPEWGFTAGGKARQRLPQACRNCRAKKIRCVESDHDELMCQHCMKMRILCQRYEKEDDKKKKHRGSQSQDYIKVENGDRSGSVVSEAGAPMSAPSRNGPKKRKSTDEGLNCGSGKRLNRGSESRAGSMTREPLNTTHTLADASPKTRHTPLSSENPPFFPSNTSDATASKCQGEPRGNHVKQLRENQLMVSQAQEMHGHGRTTSSMTDASPHSYPSSSPTTSVSGMPNSFVEHSSYALADSRHQRAANTSTPATPLDTPSMIPHPMGEDHRHPDLPGPPKLVYFVDTYFANVYSQTYAFLHRPTFMRDLSSHLPVLLFSMCAVAARFSRFPEEEAFYAKRARELIMVNYDNYNLEVVQSMVHMGLHDFGSNNGHKAWMFAGMAVRMGAALNMNLENRKKSGPRDAVSRECARRTYWSYYLMDRFNSYGVARPFLTQDHDCHIQLPCNQPSFTDGRFVKTQHLLGRNPYYPETGTEYMGAMAYLVRVVGIWGNILKQIHLSGFQIHSPSKPSSRGKGSGDEFENFIEKLEDWRKALPPGLEYSNENLAGQIKVGTTGAFVMMHVMWHTAMAYVHRYVRTVGVPKDYIQDNIPADNIIESIRKAFVHADAVLQIMYHVQQKKNEAATRGEPPITVNAPFLGQAISDACNITVIRALEVRGEVPKQKERVSVGVQWLKELKRYWKPIEDMYKKLKKTCRSLDRGMSQPPSAHMVPTPESSIDSGLQPGTRFTVDPTEYAAEPPFTSGADLSQPTIGNFAQFSDYLSIDNLPPHLFGEAFSNDMSQYHIAEYARHEGGFPDLYGESELSTVSAPFDFGMGTALDGVGMAVGVDVGVRLDMGQMEEPMQIDQPMPPAMANAADGSMISFMARIGAGSGGESSEDGDDDDDGDDAGGRGDDGDNLDPSRVDGNGPSQHEHAKYFDPNAVRDGYVPDSSSDASGHSRRASEAAVARHNNPMDVLHLINQDGVDLTSRLRAHQNEPDEFTGPGGRAAPGDTEVGGRPNLDNSGGTT